MGTLILLTLLVGLSAYAQPSQGPYPSGEGTNGGGPPTGAAGGALSGTYPNPTLAQPITGDGGGLTNVSVVYSNTVHNIRCVNVLDFGADNTGTTNGQQVAISNAMAFASTTKNGVYFPAGTYLINGPIGFELPTPFITDTAFDSFHIIGDGMGTTRIVQSSTNSAGFACSNGCQGLYVSDIALKGPLTGANACSSIGFLVTTNGAAGNGSANNGNLFERCQIYNWKIGMSLWMENSKLHSCTIQDNVTGVYNNTLASGNNNFIVDDCQFTKGGLSSALAAGPYSMTCLRIDTGAGHIITGSTFTGYKGSDVGIGFYGIGLEVIGCYVEMNGCGEFINAVPTNGLGRIDLIGNSGITGGADGNTNHYPIEFGGGMSLTVSASEFFQGWSADSFYKMNQGTYTTIDFAGFNTTVKVDEYNTGTFVSSHLITPNPFVIADATSTNSQTASSWNMTVGGTSVWSGNSSGVIRPNAIYLIPTAQLGNPGMGEYSGDLGIRFWDDNNGWYWTTKGGGANVAVLDHSGDLTLSGTLTVTGNATFATNVSIGGNIILPHSADATTVIDYLGNIYAASNAGFVLDASGNFHGSQFGSLSANTVVSNNGRFIFWNAGANTTGTVTVNGTSSVSVGAISIDSLSQVFFTVIPGTSPSATIGTPYVVTISPGTGFTIKSTSSTDTTTQYRWILVDCH